MATGDAGLSVWARVTRGEKINAAARTIAKLRKRFDIVRTLSAARVPWPGLGAARTAGGAVRCSRLGGLVRLDFGGRVYAARQLLATRKRYVDDAANRVAILDLQSTNGYLIADL